jgi:uncharacterized protein DUF3105
MTETAAPPEPPAGPAGPGRSEPRRRRAAVVLALLAAVLVLMLAAVAPAVVERVRDRGDPTASPGAASLDAVQVFRDLRRDHTESDVDYPQVPPVGGPHDPVWLDCGAYDAPVRDENAVHDLEHGTVWISYEPGLAPDDVATLQRELPQNGLLAPYDGLPAPVVVTVWERQLRLTGADDPRLGLFLARFGDGHTAPEPFASCAGGVRETDDGGGTVI